MWVLTSIRVPASHSQAEAEQERRREEARQLAERALRADAEAVAAQVAAAGEIFLFVLQGYTRLELKI